MEYILIFALKSPSDTDCLYSRGTKVRIFGLKWDRVPIPWQTECTFRILNLTGLRSL